MRPFAILILPHPLSNLHLFKELVFQTVSSSSGVQTYQLSHCSLVVARRLTLEFLSSRVNIWAIRLESFQEQWRNREEMCVYRGLRCRSLTSELSKIHCKNIQGVSNLSWRLNAICWARQCLGVITKPKDQGRRLQLQCPDYCPAIKRARKLSRRSEWGATPPRDSSLPRLSHPNPYRTSKRQTLLQLTYEKF